MKVSLSESVMHDATNAPIGDFENTPIFPQQGKIGSVSGLALLQLKLHAELLTQLRNLAESG